MKRLVVVFALAVSGVLASPSAAKELNPGLSKCYEIKDKDWQRFCIARRMDWSEKCLGIRNDDVQAYCLAVTTHAKTRCWSIRNKALQNRCVSEFK